MRPSRELRSLRIDDIYVGERLRALSEARVTAIAASLDELGLQTPLSVRFDEGPIEIDGEAFYDVPRLIAGRHRLEAGKRLGWGDIECFVLQADDVDSLLWECDENLARSELSAEEKRAHLLRRKELWERRKAESGTQRPTLENPRSGRGNTGFAADTAEKTGLKKRQINRLLKEPKAPPAERASASGAHASDRRVTAAQNAYLKLSDAERNVFREWMADCEPAVFDATRAGRAA